ncbi:glycosyltransferase [Pseudovibrio sp. SPO723]|uniref:glycosyltransferase n=1 Tax=Nesiotobacter zosterae TaxID=392721 RepID=UPI0029C4509C|nr:glycosyltransferase [Pseudovibrio sp. SPO723]MDX5593062.1 glycosyltransferase [Pseudovibrio sp. SPO723]
MTTHNSEQCLVHTLSSLVPAAAEGVLREVIVVDRGSTDATHEIADASGALWVSCAEGNVPTVELALEHARRGEWFLFLRPDVILEQGWQNEAMAFIERAQRSSADTQLAVLRYKSDDFGFKVRLKETLVNFSSQVLGITHPCQGLLASRSALLRNSNRTAKISAPTPAQILRKLRQGRPTTLRAAAIRIASQ